jgi:hypothetical protein
LVNVNGVRDRRRAIVGMPAVGTARLPLNSGKGIAMVNAQLAKGEELVRRLGMAVADKWGAIPPFAQDQILDQACESEIWPTGVDVRQALKSFLERDLPSELPVE